MGTSRDSLTPEQVDRLLHALAEPHRLEIVRLVASAELGAGDIADRFQLTRAAISEHLHVLRKVGLVRWRRDGARRFYSAEPGVLAALADRLRDLSESAEIVVASL